MAHVLVNALSLRPGGGLQVIMGLLASFSDQNRYTIIWSDPRSLKYLQDNLADKHFVSFDCPLGSKVTNMRTFFWQMMRLSKYAKNNDVDVVLSVNHHFPMGQIPQIIYHLSMLRFERPLCNLWKSGEIQDRLRDWRAEKAIRLANANVLESQYLRRLAENKYGLIRNPNVIYIGLRDEVAESMAAASKATSSILAVTSPQPHKDNPTLIRMMSELKQRRPEIPWRLRVAGGNPDAFEDLKSMANDLGVGEQIDFIGFKSHSELSEIAKSSLCLVTPSLRESFCMVALEAMSWGCPALVANTAAMPESVGEAGILVEPGSAEGFAESVMQLLDEPDIREHYIAKGFHHAKQNTWSKSAARFEALIATVS
ncbi:MAG: glycosyltransferase [Rhizobiaceae bacterium]